MQGSVNKWSKSTDDDLRPWLKDEHFEDKIIKERAALADTISRTSYSRSAGSIGSSELDPRAPELIEAARLCDELAREAEVEYEFDPQSDMDGNDGNDVTDQEGSEDLQMDDYAEADPAEGEAEDRDEFCEEEHVPKRKAIYNKKAYPAIANMSTAQYRKILKSMEDNNSTLSIGQVDVDARSLIKILPKQFTGKKLQLGDSVDLMSSMVVTHKAGAKLGEFIDRDRVPTTLGAVVTGMPADGADDDQKRPGTSGGSERRKKPPLQLSSSDQSLMTGRTGVDSDERSTMTADTILYANKRESHTDALLNKLNKASSVGMHIIHSARKDDDFSQYSTADGGVQLPDLNMAGVALNRTNLVPMSPVQKTGSDPAEEERRPGSAASKSFFMTFLTDDNDTGGTAESLRPKTSARAANHAPTNTNPHNVGSLPNTPGNLSARRPGTSGSRPSTSGGGIPRSASLGKMVISTDQGTAKPESFSRRRISQVRTLRDQLMTAAGRDSMSARLALLEDRGEHGGDSSFFKTLSAGSPTSSKTFTAERMATQKMVNNTKLKNKVDQTWPVFVTPGFEEVVGVENVYMSHTKRTHSPPTKEKRSRQISQM